MADLRPVTCCFSGYRIEKMPFRNDDCPAARELFAALDAAVAEAAADGCTRFLSGMSTGFDLWAAEAVLRARRTPGAAAVCCAVDDRPIGFRSAWKRRFNRCLLAAEIRCTRSRGAITPGALPRATGLWWMHRQGSSVTMMDGRAVPRRPCIWLEQSGLKIVNLADGQLSLL